MPLLVALGAARPLQALILGWLAGTAFFAVTLHWIYLTCRFAGVPVPVSFLAWSALAVFGGASWALFAAGVHRLRRLPEPLWPWACAALWTGIEFALARWTPRVGADLLGYSQWRFLSMLQPSAWFGPHALGFLIVAFNASLAAWVLHKSPRLGRGTLSAAALALAWWAAGFGSLRLADASLDSGPTRRVAVLQPNIDQYRKWDEKEVEGIRSVFDGLLAQAAEAKPDLIVWPETSVPGWLEDNQVWLSAWTRKTGIAQLVGTLTAVNGDRQNSAVMLDSSGRLTGSYHKRELVPFGEYVPFRAQLEPYVGILSQMGDLVPGKANQPALDTPVGPVGVTLCYEAVFPRWSRLNVRSGARVLANLTNDGWYKDTWGPWQHFYTNRFRAIENRAVVIRAGNTGISALIDPWGRVTAKLDLLRRGVLVGEFPSKDSFPRRSLYARSGDWFGWLMLAASALALAASYSSLSREG